MPADPDAFEAQRAHLLRVGYRSTGSVVDAEDAVQDAWLRWSALSDEERAEVRDERAFLTTTVARLCLDRLRSAAARRSPGSGSASSSGTAAMRTSTATPATAPVIESRSEIVMRPLCSAKGLVTSACGMDSQRFSSPFGRAA